VGRDRWGRRSVAFRGGAWRTGPDAGSSSINLVLTKPQSCAPDPARTSSLGISGPRAGRTGRRRDAAFRARRRYFFSTGSGAVVATGQSGNSPNANNENDPGRVCGQRGRGRHSGLPAWGVMGDLISREQTKLRPTSSLVPVPFGATSWSIGITSCGARPNWCCPN
jgi:hypothetical protein